MSSAAVRTDLRSRETGAKRIHASASGSGRTLVSRLFHLPQPCRNAPGSRVRAQQGAQLEGVSFATDARNNAPVLEWAYHPSHAERLLPRGGPIGQLNSARMATQTHVGAHRTRSLVMHNGGKTGHVWSHNRLYIHLESSLVRRPHSSGPSTQLHLRARVPSTTRHVRRPGGLCLRLRGGNRCGEGGIPRQ